MKNTPPIMNMLNDVAWHTMEINRISDSLNKLGVTDEAIEAFLDSYQTFFQESWIIVEERKKEP